MTQKIAVMLILMFVVACTITNVSYSIEANYESLKLKIIKVKYYNEETGQEEEKIIYKPSYGKSWFKGNGIGIGGTGEF